MKTKNKLAAAILATIALVSSAQAAPITGTVTLTADASAITIDQTLNTVTFAPAAPAANAKIDTTTIAILPTGTSIVYKNFAYDPLTVINPIWATVGSTVSFSLTSISSIVEAPSGLLLFGTGVISSTIAGWDATPGSWSFNASATGATFAWGSTVTSAPRVPDGGTTIALLGLSLLGMAGVKRKLR